MGQRPAPAGPQPSDELTRLARRWHTLPLRQALPYAAQLRAVAQRLFDVLASRTGAPTGLVPDLGPVTALDQLRVAVHEVSVLGDRVLDAHVAAELAALRRGIPEPGSQAPALGGLGG